MDDKWEAASRPTDLRALRRRAGMPHRQPRTAHMPRDLSGAEQFRRWTGRVLEQIVSALVTAAALWLVALAAGFARGSPWITAVAVLIVSFASLAAASIHPGLRWSARAIANVLNLSTPLGLVVARLGRARLTRGPQLLVFAEHYRKALPMKMAFTIGNVVITRRDAEFVGGRLLEHESRHATQYAWGMGVLAIFPYVLASVGSVLLTGDAVTLNVFERMAGLEEAGYPALHRPGILRRIPEPVLIAVTFLVPLVILTISIGGVALLIFG